MTEVTIHSDFGAQWIKSVMASTFPPSIFHEVMGPDAMILVLECWVLNHLFHSLLSLSSRGCLVPFPFCHDMSIICISEVVVISLGNLDSSLWFIHPAFWMMYSVYKLNKQGDSTALPCYFPNLEPVRCSMSGSNSCFLTCIQVSQETSKVVWYSHIFKNFLQFVWSTQLKAFT